MKMRKHSGLMSKEVIKVRILEFLNDRKGSFGNDVVTHPAWGMARKMNLDHAWYDFWDALEELVGEGIIDEIQTTGMRHQQSWYQLYVDKKGASE